MKTKKAPKEKTPETYEELLAEEYKRLEYDFKWGHPPPVNYRFRVGEKVKIGNLADCRVEEVLRDGMLIHFSYHDKGESYGKPFDNKHRLPRLYWWNQVTPLEPVQETNLGRIERINTQSIQTTLESLIHTCYWRGLIDSPEYQRDYVWTLEDKQRLVRSMMDRADIGKFVTMSHPFPENRIEIIDGKQRLRAIMDFLEGRFEYEGYNWFQFSFMDKHIFLDSVVQVIELQSERVKKSDVLWLFLSINRGGVPQTDEHIARIQKLYDEAVKSGN